MEKITVREVTSVLKDLRMLLKRSGSSKEQMNLVETILFAALGAPAIAEAAQCDHQYLHVDRR